MNDVEVQFVLKVGSDFLAESALPAPLPPTGTSAGIDGALCIHVNDNEVLGTRHWDRLDIVAHNVRGALDAALAGETADATFPDTRLTLTIAPAGDGLVSLSLEGIAMTAPATALDRALDACIRRLLALGPALHRTEALESLETRAAQDA